jgi:hypothetical protein
MIVHIRRSLYKDGGGIRTSVPKLWADALSLKAGDRVDLLFDEVLVVIPRPSKQAERVRRAMEG